MTDLLFNFLFDTALNARETLADVGALVSAITPVIKPAVAAPAPEMTIDTLLALPDGFRAAGYEALTITKSVAGN